ncbi:hypothetical protein [Bradyrhizobium genosp. P]|uniref:hypothetical protein n=1 Tax=Bradyrhizobium genosp. P TaxID=83641 RepID=UPI003CE805C3
MKTPAEQFAQIERDIADHKFGEKVEHERANRERPNWTAEDAEDFAAQRKGAAEHLLELVRMRDELRREVRNDPKTP